MKSSRFSFLIVLALILAACSIPPTPDGSSGVFGQVTLGPVCPVVKIGEDCPDRPYQATLSILTVSGAPVTRIETNAEGKFRVALAPGDYLLRPETPGNRPMPNAQEQKFTVTTGQFTELQVTYDSGIR